MCVLAWLGGARLERWQKWGQTGFGFMRCRKLSWFPQTQRKQLTGSDLIPPLLNISPCCVKVSTVRGGHFTAYFNFYSLHKPWDSEWYVEWWDSRNTAAARFSHSLVSRSVQHVCTYFCRMSTLSHDTYSQFCSWYFCILSTDLFWTSCKLLYWCFSLNKKYIQPPSSFIFKSSGQSCYCGCFFIIRHTVQTLI